MARRPFAEIRSRYQLLSSDQKRVADLIMSDTSLAPHLTLSELAARCRLSETTVVRFIKKLGYDSYQLFRLEAAQEAAQAAAQQAAQESAAGGLRTADAYGDVANGDGAETVLRKVCAAASSSIADVAAVSDAASLERLVDWLLGAERVLFHGAGGSAVVALDAHHKFLRLGLNALHESVGHLAIIRAAHLGPNDLAVLFSHSGESREVLECGRNAAAAGCRVVAVTSYPKSTLARSADLVLLSSSAEPSFYTDAMVSRLVQLVLFDAVFVAASLRLGKAGADAVERSRKAIAGSKKMDRE